MSLALTSLSPSPSSVHSRSPEHPPSLWSLRSRGLLQEPFPEELQAPLGRGSSLHHTGSQTSAPGPAAASSSLEM